jgi:hypothetical protein
MTDEHGVLRRVVHAVAGHRWLSAGVVFGVTFLVFLLLPLPTHVKGGRTILVPAALLNQYVTAYQQRGWDIAPNPVRRFAYFLTVHLTLATLVALPAFLRLMRRGTQAKG